MDRCALFVDAGYVLTDGAMAVHGTRRRESVSWDYGGLLQLLASLAMERSRLPLLRCYWYEATVEGKRSDDHEALADLPGVKLRVAKMWPGRREGAEIQRDLTTLARNKAVSDAMVVSAEENLAKVISDVQDMGMRVTLLNIDVEGSAAVSRSLRQECDDIVEISSAHLRPYVELIPGAEPPRAEERDGALVALRPAGQQTTAPAYAVAAVPDYAEYPQYPDYQRDPGQQDYAESAAAAETGALAPATDNAVTAAAQDFAIPDFAAPDFAAPEYAIPDYAGGERGADYGSAQDYGQGAPPAPQERVAAHEAQQSRQDYGLRRVAPRPDPAPRAEPAAQELYAAPVVVPAVAEELAAERPPGRPRQETDLPRPVESGYSPGPMREQFQADALSREPLAGTSTDRYQQVPVPVPASPVPAGSAQVRRLPMRGPGQPGPAMGQPEPPVPMQVPVPPSGAQAGMPTAPIENRGMGYPGQRGGSYGGPRPIGTGPGGSAGPAAAGAPPSFADQPSGGSLPAGPALPMALSGQSVPPAPGAGPGQGQVPPSGPAAPVPLPAQSYSGGQSGVSLADAVQSAHEEGQAFGESVARDAPTLWLEAVLARKPRMPSDLEARLLQGSALPIDFLLHDEVRHALRRGFWDALERARR